MDFGDYVGYVHTVNGSHRNGTGYIIGWLRDKPDVAIVANMTDIGIEVDRACMWVQSGAQRNSSSDRELVMQYRYRYATRCFGDLLVPLDTDERDDLEIEVIDAGFVQRVEQDTPEQTRPEAPETEEEAEEEAEEEFSRLTLKFDRMGMNYDLVDSNDMELFGVLKDHGIVVTGIEIIASPMEMLEVKVTLGLEGAELDIDLGPGNIEMLEEFIKNKAGLRKKEHTRNISKLKPRVLFLKEDDCK